MPKPPKTPRPIKPPLKPPPPNEKLNHTLNVGQEKLIGRMVVAWAKLESLLGELVWFLLGVELERGRILTARMDANATIKLIRELGNVQLSEIDLHKLSPILDRIDIVREDRNFVMHGIWGRNSRGIPIAFSIRQKGLSPSQVVAETFPIDRMRTLINTIEALRRELSLLMKELGVALPDIPQQPHPAAW